MASAWGAGLCLIVGVVALEAGRPGPVAHLPEMSGHDAMRQASSSEVARTFNGTGNQVTQAFRIGANGRWQLGWSYHCAVSGPAGHLAIRELGRAASIIVNAAGPAGRGQTWTDSGAGRHRLQIRSDCSWTIKVAGYR
jgi:hypothetical protein